MYRHDTFSPDATGGQSEVIMPADNAYLVDGGVDPIVIARARHP